MSRSYRSQKESVIAKGRIQRRADGSVVMPRIIERLPTHGDIHPVTKSVLARLLTKLPLDYLYGLSRIELRARRGLEIGAPFGCYRPDERAIILYSLPLVWHSVSLTLSFGASLQKFCAVITPEGDNFTVSWPNRATMALWFYCDVFIHELGHHFVEQYKGKNSRIASRRHGEMVADLHARRFTDDLLASIMARRMK